MKYYQHLCTIKRATTTTVKHTERVAYSSIASNVECTLWTARDTERDTDLARDTRVEKRDFMTDYAIQEGDIVEVAGFWSYKCWPVDINKSISIWTNYSCTVEKYGSL